MTSLPLPYKSDTGHAFQIDIGLPIPEKVQGNTGQTKSPMRLAIEALASSQLGSSLLYQTTNPKKNTQRLHAMARSAAGPNWYTVRAVADGVRVWKTAEPSPAQPTT